MPLQLITRELWHSLHHALPRHPLLWYPLRGQDVRLQRPSLWIEVVPTGLLMISALLSIVLWIAYGVSPLVLVLVMDTYAGLIVVRGVTGSMQRAHEHGLLELMGVTPSGRMAAAWALMTRYLRRDQTLSGIHQAAAWLHATWMFALLPYGALMAVTFCSSTPASQTNFGAIFNQPLSLLNGFIIFGVMIMDYLGALVAGALIGMIVPGIGGLRAEAVFLAPMAYLGLQAVNYAALLLLHVVLNSALSLPGWLNGWSSSITFIICFVVVRESLLWMLCFMLARQMNAPVRDVLQIYRRSL